MASVAVTAGEVTVADGVEAMVAGEAVTEGEDTVVGVVVAVGVVEEAGVIEVRTRTHTESSDATARSAWTRNHHSHGRNSSTYRQLHLINQNEISAEHLLSSSSFCLLQEADIFSSKSYKFNLIN